ncbi:MAG: methyltransferase domain-containing protein [Deltaproteobacteria bacterium]|nr:methyltransferase domain-containing protein [Deltaproteobacteria bacterium]
MPDKNLIKRAFSRAASTYDESAELQRDVCRELAAIACAALAGGSVCFAGGPAAACGSHQPHKELKILDAGAGTGQLAACVSGMFPGAGAEPLQSVIACDIALSMLVKAKEGRVSRAVCADFGGLPFADGLFDAVVSSLAYQWADNLGRVFKEAGRVLRPGGHFIFSTLGPKTLHEMRESFKAAKNGNSSMPFATIDGIKTALEAACFEAVVIEERPRLKVYNDMVHLLKTLKSVGALGRAGRRGLANPSLIKEAGRIYKERFPASDEAGNAGVVATYDVIFASARRI